MNDTVETILKSAKHFFSGTFLSRLSGMLRDICMAYAFGAHASIAAFLVAFRFSHLLRRLLGEGALQSAFIPLFEKMRHESPQKSANFFYNLTATLCVTLLFIVLTSMSALSVILYWGNLKDGNAEICKLTLMMMPSLIFICLFGINASIMQCEKKYFTAGVAPVAFNLCWIFGILFLKDLEPSQSVFYLTFFVNIACVAQWLITLPQTAKILKNLGLQTFKRVSFFSKDALLILKPLSLGVIGIGSAQINNALDSIFARFADSSGPAYLWYAIRLQQLPLALFGIAIAAAMLPPLSRSIKNQSLNQFKEFLGYALEKSTLLMVPITFALFILGYSSVNLIYGHGDFDTMAVKETTLCLLAYGVGLFPMALILLLAPAFYAQNDYKTPTVASLLSILINMILNFILIVGLKKGSASVALATSIAAWVNLFILGRYLKISIGPFVSSHLKKQTVLLTGMCLLAFSSVTFLNHYLNQPTVFTFFQDKIFLSIALEEQIYRLLIETSLFFGILGICWIIQSKVVRQGIKQT